jgi:hypothetical protein
MPELVRAVIGDREVNVSAAYAVKHDLQVLDEPTHRDDGRPRPETRRGGRPNKPKTSVAKKAAAKKAEPAQESGPSADDNPPSEKEND